MMDKEVGGGFLLGAAVGHLENDLLMISHLFVDDTLNFSNATPINFAFEVCFYMVLSCI